MLSIGLALAGCGGGGQSSSPAVTSPAVARTVSGVAATGAPLSGTVYLKDSTGLPELSAPIASDGSFSFTVDGYTPPFIVKSEGTANGSTYTLYSFATADGIANVNPLSNLVVAQASDSTDLATLYAAPDPAKMQALKAVLPGAISNVQTAFATQLSGVGAATINFISDPYLANTGLPGIYSVYPPNFSAYPANTPMYVVVVGQNTSVTTTPPDLTALTAGGTLVISSLQLYGTATLTIDKAVSIANLQTYDTAGINVLAPLALYSLHIFGNSFITLGGNIILGRLVARRCGRFLDVLKKCRRRGLGWQLGTAATT